MTPKQFTFVAARLAEEMRQIEYLLAELSSRQLINAPGNKLRQLIKGDTFTLRAAGSVLHDFYVAAENIFKIIARELDEKTPAGEHWHRELILQMTLDLPGIRPPVISKHTARKLDEFRAFRHVFRNVYGFNLSEEKISALLEKLPAVSAGLTREVQLFIQKMQQIIQ